MLWPQIFIRPTAPFWYRGSHRDRAGRPSRPQPSVVMVFREPEAGWWELSGPAAQPAEPARTEDGEGVACRS